MNIYSSLEKLIFRYLDKEIFIECNENDKLIKNDFSKNQ